MATLDHFGDRSDPLLEWRAWQFVPKRSMLKIEPS
jgi:hypothetical protein